MSERVCVGQCVHSQGWAPGVLPLSMCSVLLCVYLGGGYSFPFLSFIYSLDVFSMCGCTLAYVHACLCVCVCVREREGQKERERLGGGSVPSLPKSLQLCH